ncbi:hypothetical protein [Klebsiella pneumoniae]|uniref:hypothetical protein n=1 Tax=Klebsiella pneumoniae TaxID=573 RepID=UPI001F5DBDFC|nr:hypothetical protein [Klebsiella pneumoniae]
MAQGTESLGCHFALSRNRPHHSGQVSGQRDTASADQSEQVIRHLKQEIEHLNTLLLSKDSHIDSLKQAMLLLENHQAKLTESPAPWWKFWKKS